MGVNHGMSVSRRAFTLGLGTVPLHLRSGETPEEQGHQSQKAAGGSKTGLVAIPKPKLFDEHELATVTALADVIIPATDTPGAREAHVAEYLDLILSDSPESVRTSFCEGLWWTDGHCQRTAGAPFRDLPSAEQLRVVSALHDSPDESEHTGRLFIRSMKIWTARIYYSTEIGAHELNKDGRVPPAYFGHCAS
jgi:gluconate 2-dehydrogenase gamma chain